jgi:hypothetical protein
MVEMAGVGFRCSPELHLSNSLLRLLWGSFGRGVRYSWNCIMELQLQSTGSAFENQSGLLAGCLQCSGCESRCVRL